ncbi:MAG: PHP domain-containing protein [Anaerolineae bacterium]|nr:PHP domain-containing protein [Thermoflexales bacterium]MDW8406558.1 PHP domain-containing protein [Anaerolineae bacterium]
MQALEADLNSFDGQVRAQALDALLALAANGSVPLPPQRDAVNMHCHSFYSFNAYGHSPTSLVWLAKKLGLKAIGIVDFDVLDGIDEFLSACERAAVRGSAAIETRVHIPEFATREINSPGEPGIFYHMGIGFAQSHIPAHVQPIARALRERAAQRNRAMVDRINAYLHPVTVDYEADVLPLTPAGNATERHLLVAYLRAAERHYQGQRWIEFWSSRLDTPADKIVAIMNDVPAFANLIRAKLMKKGGVGYAQPVPANFPTVEEYHQFILACGALPCATWLDGLSEGEQAEAELLELLIGKGVVALNIIPDRNWNIGDPALRQTKVRELYKVVDLATQLDLPVHVGTEMNAFGNKLVDDFDAPELAPVRQAFLDGAFFIYGHTVMQRAHGLGYQSGWAQAQLPTRRARNTFYLQVGHLTPAGQAGLAKLRRVNPDMTPQDILHVLG